MENELIYSTESEKNDIKSALDGKTIESLERLKEKRRIEAEKEMNKWKDISSIEFYYSGEEKELTNEEVHREFQRHEEIKSMGGEVLKSSKPDRDTKYFLPTAEGIVFLSSIYKRGKKSKGIIKEIDRKLLEDKAKILYQESISSDMHNEGGEHLFVFPDGALVTSWHCRNLADASGCDSFRVVEPTEQVFKVESHDVDAEDDFTREEFLEFVKNGEKSKYGGKLVYSADMDEEAYKKNDEENNKIREGKRESW